MSRARGGDAPAIGRRPQPGSVPGTRRRTADASGRSVPATRTEPDALGTPPPATSAASSWPSNASGPNRKKTMTKHDDTFPSLMPDPDLPLIPVAIGPTTRKRHITGTTALNIPDPWDFNGGDWHQHATWFWTEPETLEPHHFTDDETYGAVFDRLGAHGVRDARRGLRELGHPAGDSDTPIWTAAYDRAVIEIAWQHIQDERKHGPVSELTPIDPYQLVRWIGSPLYWARLKWWAWKLRWALTSDECQRWDGWRKEWSPWA